MAYKNRSDIEYVLTSYRNWAVVGASNKPERASHAVMAFLLDQGYSVVPVNPLEKQVHSLTCYATLLEACAHHPIEVVDVFRRPSETVELARNAIAIGANAIWFQLGVINLAAARTAKAAGLRVVMDACPIIEAQRMGNGLSAFHRSRHGKAQE